MQCLFIQQFDIIESIMLDLKLNVNLANDICSHPRYRSKITDMFSRQFIRFYATEQSALAALRKKTGYTFVNCKKALELNNNDIVKV